ncbi:nuclear transport factor 2 family protein [Nocardia pseudobrasiliensis]|nr:nuclear transport factor 2 family protein [Nocardia pseudobrasiliensis]
MTDTPVRTPRELVEEMFNGLAARDSDAFASWLAPDAVFEMPFTLEGTPERVEGREAIRDHLAQRRAATTGIEVHGIHPQVYETADPELLFVENEVDMTLPGEPRARIRTSVNVVRVRDGKVVLFRDYMNAAVLARLVR